jgi:hypothetical protein
MNTMYLTRNLTAARAMTHDGQDLEAGQPFTASEVDASYLLSRGRAFPAAEPVATEAPPPVPAPASAPVRAPRRARATEPAAAQGSLDDAPQVDTAGGEGGDTAIAAGGQADTGEPPAA